MSTGQQQEGSQPKQGLVHVHIMKLLLSMEDFFFPLRLVYLSIFFDVEGPDSHHPWKPGL